MKKIAIVGGGIIGMTLASYLDKPNVHVTVFDNEVGQATKASAGIISPWLSKRRNKQWYQLAKEGAAFYEKLVVDFQLDHSVYTKSGTLLLRKKNDLVDLASLAEERKQDAPEIGEIALLSAEQTQQQLPLLGKFPALKISGGGRLDGAAYLNRLKKRAALNGVTLCQMAVAIKKEANHWVICQRETGESIDTFDFVALTAGPGLNQLLTTLDYKVDIRPQKGQLLSFTTNFKESTHWPVAMLDGESDLIPFSDGTILLGATHENDKGFDLTPTKEAYEHLRTVSQPFLSSDILFSGNLPDFRVGTRAYTSDFAPFFGPLPDDETLVVASGLGSSGLTTGPYIGYLLANYFQTNTFDSTLYQKKMETYIQKR
ncbi:FAD dependent oxidoreductase [Enterococcus phoeniculicola]|uniref:FAD dependent oxidoreductase n=1 Tax=Enterococcus phoeniculicola ATCC BAA-412 TaxID=1158610 RepID=R3TLU2_9ENTE|nr:FAD-dependent oxidoreductase [Enterococcus phoeniculicola]EOL42449.1 FAD dependent oxidoreductase [Enterococcus phoeniculicola ATCC BAA-412]EOT79272.1 FAD dependent oxidoreductase [Enterococcus phoeniculicola ATCC BAA-412]OJG73190.1 FAD dependent oxidoreductase [Enterococcus phoeniculicola]